MEAQSQIQSDNTTQSSNQQSAVLNHLKEPSTWMRILYMVFFMFAYIVVEFILTGIVIVQVFFSLFTGKTNDRLRSLGSDLSKYVYDILSFLTFSSEQKPFPFSDWKQGRVAD